MARNRQRKGAPIAEPLVVGPSRLLVGLLLAAAVLQVFVGFSRIANGDYGSALLSIAVIAIAAAISRQRLVLDQDGVAYRSLIRERRWAWNQVEGVDLGPGGLLTPVADFHMAGRGVPVRVPGKGWAVRSGSEEPLKDALEVTLDKARVKVAAAKR